CIESIETAKATAYLFSEPDNYIERLIELKEISIPVYKEELLLTDGRIFEFDYKPIFGDNNVINGHLWIFRDITPYKTLENSQKLQQAFYQKVLNNIPADIAILDKEQKYVFANKASFEGDIIRDWIVGKDDFDYSLSKNKGFERAFFRRNYFEQALNTHQIVQFEEKDINERGQEVSSLRHYYPYINEGKEVEFVVGYGVNISKTRQNENLLIRSIDTYQNLIHNLDEVVFIVDKNNVLQYVNTLWEKVFNKSYYESVGNAIDTFFSPAIFEFIENDLAQIKTDLSVDKIKREIRIDHQDGSIKYYNYCFSRFYSALKEDLMVSGFVVDITDQVQAREELHKVLQKERLLSNMKTVFVNMVSHELRTPLAIIQSSAEILELLCNQDTVSKETIGDYTLKIVDEVKSLKVLMDELLIVSRIETDKHQFNATEIDIIGFIENIINAHYNPWKDGRILTLEVRGITRNILGDSFMLKHIIGNILDNAFKYSKGKQVPMVRLFFGQDHWSLVCRDYGIGIPENEMNSLGTSFKRGSNVEFIPGTGLGLVVINYFVEKHNGTVQYQSSVGKGTFVRISFPY
ncbi:MAG: PAS domain-containing sensor histidine kinase, partial [Chitinophagia bacterium]